MGVIVTDHSTSSAILRCTGLRKTFIMGEATIDVLKKVDLNVQPGEFVAIEGRSGSGKSTLLHLLSGLEAPDDGSVWFEGQDIARDAVAAEKARRIGRRDIPWMPAILRPIVRVPLGLCLTLWGFLLQVLHLLAMSSPDRRLAAIRSGQFGFVFQFYHLLPEFDVLENTLLAPMTSLTIGEFRSQRKELEKRAVQLLIDLGVGHRLRHRPSQLSGGERQRVAIARALMNQPKILFADEPTGNLDAETGRQIMGVLKKLHVERGQTIVMVTHDRALAREEADRVLILREGKLEAENSK